METTLNQEAGLWYANGPHMNMSYWPLDYPPLCAYTHLGMAHIVNFLVPEALQGKPGFSSPLYRAIMRAALIILELVILVPAAVRLLALLYPKTSATTRRLLLLLFLCLPPLIFIDHGHF